MATTPTPPPAKAPPPPARIEPRKMGFDVTRPFRWGFSMIKGLIGGGLDGMANLGRKGFWVGTALGLLVGVSTGGLGYIFMGAIGGLVVGAGVGAIGGGLLGGYRNISRERRRELYADELAERQTARAARESRQAPAPQYDNYREPRSAQQGVSNYNFERALQQDRENDRDYSTYWQDRMERSHANGNGRGF